ncbi:alpha/beta fold hydrolase [Rhodoblastus acidophilus]|uniref:Alpha/beta fold hydrolase n=1 Tax=Rhodoblastus acidophilus TaxID=1074 RepID=A0A6N8DPX4_RHOAC|nr:alpha/beta hydrolase [Rhodoblastus acidophilus]MCW2274294.1 pimeloyl-ACP methyl ester carboxylesterase [Rhodoblastus acidophilus]MTV31253.1 alpha/beta fold hydrolase [Rhodoblastus acidophilus]
MEDTRTSAASRRAFLAGAAAAPLLAAPARAQSKAAASEKTLEPMGVCFEGWPYPGPVKFLALDHGEPTRMAYMDFPAADGFAKNRAVMLLHGKNFDSSYWTDVIAFLRRAGFRVIVPDQIGFNKSSKPIRTYSFADLVANTLSLADGLGLRTFDVIGHSTGGMLAVHLASKHPARVRKLVLEDPIGLVDYRDHIPPQTLATLEKAEAAYDEASYRAFVARYFVSLPAAQYEPFVTSRMRLALSGDYPRYLRVVALTYLMIYNEPVRKLFGSLRPPTLLVTGAQDKATPFLAYASEEAKKRIPPLAQAARDVAQAHPAIRHVEFPGVGHVPHLEATKDFEREVLAFLGA